MTTDISKYLKVSEDSIHIGLVKYLRTIKHQGKPVLFYHTPNGGNRNALVGQKLKRLGTLAGVYDLAIMEPVKPYHGFYLEVKTSGGRLSGPQKLFGAKASERGYHTAVCYSLSQGIDQINAYLRGAA